ncbi:MAG: hypothetical protein NTV31_16475 [Bacteroidia bacterium]|nr:hypothetical protein [Bacteroidia bacterium]
MKRNWVILLLIFLLLSCEKSQDKNENILKFYGDALEDIGYSVARVEDGYVIAGQVTEVSRVNGNYIEEGLSVKKMGVIKTDLNGNVIWKKSFGGGLAAAGSKVLTLDDGSIVCTGYVIDSLTQKDIYVVKLDVSGTATVEKIFKSDGNQYGTEKRYSASEDQQ